MARLTPGRVPARVVFRQSRDHYRFDPPNLLLTTLKVAAAIAVVSVAVRSTTFTDYNPPKQPEVFQPPNTLLTLLAPPREPPVVPVPFNQEDWPNPQRRPVRDLTWTQSPAVPPAPTITAVAPPFNQEDWRNPARQWQRDLTWTQSPKVQPILTGPSIVEGPRAHGILDYFSKQQPVVFDPPNTLALLTQPAVVVAAAVAEGQRSHGFTEFSAPKYPPQFDPPNTLALLLTQPVVVAPAGTVKPFLQSDWPNPVLRKPFRESGWNRFANIGDIPARPTPVVVIATPFSQDDWPNPIVRSVRIKTTPQSFRPAIEVTVDETTTASSTFPFSLEDWPNPVRRISPREWGFTRFANVGDIPARPTPPVVAPPFSQDDWPNPILRAVRLKTTPQSFRPAIDVTVDETTTASTSYPFSQEDWPNPTRRIAQREFGFTRFANVGDIPQRFIAPAPFDQTDWPNPLTPWRRDLNWSQSPQVQQIVPDPAGSTFPFSLTDQPNPVLRTPFKESGWVRFANIGDIPAAAPPVPVPPAPTDEVKPSGGRVRHEPVHHHAGTIDPEFRYAIEGRKTYAQKLQDLRIAQQAAEVIEQVALQQAATLEVDEAKNARELKRALRLAQIEDDARYLELLTERRELAKTEEIGALLYKAVRDEEDILALLMIAAQLL